MIAPRLEEESRLDCFARIAYINELRALTSLKGAFLLHTRWGRVFDASFGIVAGTLRREERSPIFVTSSSSVATSELHATICAATWCAQSWRRLATFLISLLTLIWAFFHLPEAFILFLWSGACLRRLAFDAFLISFSAFLVRSAIA